MQQGILTKEQFDTLAAAAGQPSRPTSSGGGTFSNPPTQPQQQPSQFYSSNGNSSLSPPAVPLQQHSSPQSLYSNYSSAAPPQTNAPPFVAHPPPNYYSTAPSLPPGSTSTSGSPFYQPPSIPNPTPPIPSTSSASSSVLPNPLPITATSPAVTSPPTSATLLPRPVIAGLPTGLQAALAARAQASALSARETAASGGSKARSPPGSKPSEKGKSVVGRGKKGKSPEGETPKTTSPPAGGVGAGWNGTVAVNGPGKRKKSATQLLAEPAPGMPSLSQLQSQLRPEAFTTSLVTVMGKRSVKINEPYFVKGRHVKLYELYQAVMVQGGGVDQVDEDKSWDMIAQYLNFPTDNDFPSQLGHLYHEVLAAYEEIWSTALLKQRDKLLASAKEASLAPMTKSFTLPPGVTPDKAGVPPSLSMVTPTFGTGGGGGGTEYRPFVPSMPTSASSFLPTPAGTPLSTMRNAIDPSNRFEELGSTSGTGSTGPVGHTNGTTSNSNSEPVTAANKKRTRAREDIDEAPPTPFSSSVPTPSSATFNYSGLNPSNASAPSTQLFDSSSFDFNAFSSGNNDTDAMFGGMGAGGTDFDFSAFLNSNGGSDSMQSYTTGGVGEFDLSQFNGDWNPAAAVGPDAGVAYGDINFESFAAGVGGDQDNLFGGWPGSGGGGTG